MHKNVFVNFTLVLVSILFMSSVWWVFMYFSMRQNFIYAAYMLDAPVMDVMSLYAQLEGGGINVFEMIWGLPPGVRGVGLLIGMLPFVFFRFAGAKHISSGGAFMLVSVALVATVFDIWTNIEGYDILARVMPVAGNEEDVIRAGATMLAILSTFSDEALMIAIEFAVISSGQIVSAFRRGGEMPEPFRIVQDSSFGNGFTNAGKFISGLSVPSFLTSRKTKRNSSSNSGGGSPPPNRNPNSSGLDTRAGVTRIRD